MLRAMLRIVWYILSALPFDAGVLVSVTRHLLAKEVNVLVLKAAVGAWA
jgi:hypothetical protein